MILAALVEAFVQGAGLAVAVFLACKKKMNDPLRSVQYRSGGDTAFLFCPGCVTAVPVLVSQDEL